MRDTHFKHECLITVSLKIILSFSFHKISDGVLLHEFCTPEHYDKPKAETQQ